MVLSRLLAGSNGFLCIDAAACNTSITGCSSSDCLNDGQDSITVCQPDLRY